MSERPEAERNWLVTARARFPWLITRLSVIGLILTGIIISLVAFVLAWVLSYHFFECRKLNNIANFVLVVSIYFSLIAAILGFGANAFLKFKLKATESWHSGTCYFFHNLFTALAVLYGAFWGIPEVQNAFLKPTLTDTFYNLGPDRFGKAVKDALIDENQPSFNGISRSLQTVNDSEIGNELIHTIIPYTDSSFTDVTRSLAITALVIIILFFAADLCGLFDPFVRKYFILLVIVGAAAICTHGLLEMSKSNNFPFPRTQVEAFMGGFLSFLLLLQNFAFAGILTWSYYEYVGTPRPRPDSPK